MNISEAMQTGHYGIKMSLPEHMIIQSDEPAILHGIDPELGVSFHIMWASQVHLDLRKMHRPHLETRLARHARHIFEAVHATVGTSEEPRTSDESWTPMVDLEYIDVHDTPALKFVHRVAYEAGSEMIMGHVLIPLKEGLFEIRVQTKEFGSTGVRECVVLAKQSPDAPFPEQAVYDDPELDEMFPDHVLSRTRRALKEMRTYIQTITAPQILPNPKYAIEAKSPTCFFRPPPRFFVDMNNGRVRRASFNVTDGLEQLVYMGGKTKSTPTKLLDQTLDALEQFHQSEGFEDVKLTPTQVDEHTLYTVVHAVGVRGAARHIFVSWINNYSRLWHLGMVGDDLTPKEDIVEELIASARTLEQPKPKKFLGLF